MNPIKYARMKALMTQEELAERLNVHPVTISFWETGKQTPSVKHYRMMANIFHCRLADLMEETA